MLGFTKAASKTTDLTPSNHKSEPFADRLIRAISAKGAPVGITLHPIFKRLPQQLRESGADPVAAIEHFCERALKALAGHVPAVLIPSSCFERYFAHGVAALNRLTAKARQLGLIVILDAGRSGFEATAIHYAAGNLADRHKVKGPDALTISAYSGRDGIHPYAEVAVQQGKGLFAEVQTSNPSGVAIQGLTLEDGRTVAEAIGQIVNQIGSDERYIGQSGYSLLGAVVGAGGSGNEAQLRRIMPQQFFLVPDFDPQQKNAADYLGACFRADKTGALICSNTDLLYSAITDADSYEDAITRSATQFRKKILSLIGRG